MKYKATYATKYTDDVLRRIDNDFNFRGSSAYLIRWVLHDLYREMRTKGINSVVRILTEHGVMEAGRKREKLLFDIES